MDVPCNGETVASSRLFTVATALRETSLSFIAFPVSLFIAAAFYAYHVVQAIVIRGTARIPRPAGRQIGLSSRTKIVH